MDQILPSLVNDIGSKVTEPFLKATQSETGRYFALSHHWGFKRWGWNADYKTKLPWTIHTRNPFCFVSFNILACHRSDSVFRDSLFLDWFFLHCSGRCSRLGISGGQNGRYLWEFICNIFCWKSRELQYQKWSKLSVKDPGKRTLCNAHRKRNIRNQLEAVLYTRRFQTTVFRIEIEVRQCLIGTVNHLNDKVNNVYAS